MTSQSYPSTVTIHRISRHTVQLYSSYYGLTHCPYIQITTFFFWICICIKQLQYIHFIKFLLNFTLLWCLEVGHLKDPKHWSYWSNPYFRNTYRWRSELQGLVFLHKSICPSPWKTGKNNPSSGIHLLSSDHSQNEQSRIISSRVP